MTKKQTITNCEVTIKWFADTVLCQNFFFKSSPPFAFDIPQGILSKNHPTITRTKFLQDDRQAFAHQSQSDMDYTGSILNERLAEASALE